jgi:hypothetical protein
MKSERQRTNQTDEHDAHIGQRGAQRGVAHVAQNANAVGVHNFKQMKSVIK